jgi:hypothetical protein
MDDKIALFLMLNEPSFFIGDKQYSVCCPDNKNFCTWDSDGNTFDFPNVSSLLDEWIIEGKAFRQIVEEIMV